MRIILDSVLAILVVLVVAALFFRVAFREQVGRAVRYFRIWSESDKRKAEEAERDAALRERAEAELHRELHGPSDDLKIGL